METEMGTIFVIAGRRQYNINFVAGISHFKRTFWHCISGFSHATISGRKSGYRGNISTKKRGIMRENRAKQKLQAGQVVTIVAGHTNTDMIDFLGQTGVDGVWLEGEHGPLSWEQIGDMSRACDLWGMTKEFSAKTAIS
jgi:hypothetical protein